MARRAGPMMTTLNPPMTRRLGRPAAAKASQFPTIVLDLELRGAWDRGVAQEIIHLGRERSWNMILAGSGVELIDIASTWKPLAVIGSFERVRPRPPVLEGVLMISLGKDATADGVPSVCPDERQVGLLAAQHLLRTGVKTTAVFAYDESAFGREKYARLQALKKEWDPDNLFCHNQNIKPS